MILPHLKISRGSIPEGVILPGAPERASLIAGLLSGTKQLAANREYLTFVGRYKGEPLAVISAGIGAAGAAIAYEEAIAAGGTLLVRVGTAGSLMKEVRSGDIVVATAAVRDEGLTRQLLPVEYPAVADPTVVSALCRSAAATGHNLHAGVVLSTEAFYPGKFSLNRTVLGEAGVLCVEMECSTLFVIGAVRRIRTGAILAVNGDTSRDKQAIESAIKAEIKAALEGVHRLLRGG